MMVRPLSKPPPSATVMKILWMPNQHADPAKRDQKNLLQSPNDMRMLGREREKNCVSYFSHLCTKVRMSQERLST